MKKLLFLNCSKKLCSFLFILIYVNVRGQVCNPLAYEGFQYTVNGPLNGQSGSNGFSNAWTVQNSNTQVPGYQITQPTGLSYLNLQTTGNAASGGNVYLTAGRPLDVSQSGPFSNYLNSSGGGIGSNGTGSIFFSALIKKSENNGEEVKLVLHNSTNVICDGCSSNNIAVGYFGSQSDVAGQRRWSLKLNGTVIPTAIAIVPNTAAFIVVRIDFASTSTVNVYVNPASIGATIPVNSTLTQITSVGFDLRSLTLYLGDDSNSGSVDEFRMASTHQCAAPDASTMVNQAPNAVFSISPNTGMTPLLTNLNASASTDDGFITTYEWNFGDGSPIVNSTSPTISHTYSSTGIFTPLLKVTDNFSISSITTQTVKVLNQNGAFSCLVNLSTLKLATCSQSNGAFLVNGLGNNSSKLISSLNQTIAANPVGTYSNLASGNYTLTVNGTDGCIDTFKVYVATDSSSCPNWTPHPCRMKMGVGLGGITYYAESTRMFKDYFKACSSWITYDPTGTNTAWNTNELSSMSLDANGYPTQCPFTLTSGPRCVRSVVSALGYFPVGVPMQLMYSGTGSVTIHGDIGSIVYSPGQINFTPTGTNNIWIQIPSSSPTNNVNNIRIVEVSDLSTYQTQIFRQNYISKCSPFHALRFMDLMGTNSNTLVSWSNRKLPSYYHQEEAGIAYEYIVEFANVTQKDIWICIPHKADNNYISQMATFFKNNLSPNITVYLEYSNETWNWLFQQSQWVYNNGPQNVSYPRRYAEIATNAFKIWKQIWTGQSANKLKCVLGTQMGYDWISQEILAHANPKDYDYLSPSFYFGLDHTTGGSPNLVALGSSATANDVINNSRNNFHAGYANWKQTYNDAKLFGKEIINYEGGQHFTDFNVPAYLPAMYAAQIDPAMYNLYQEVLDSLRILDSRLACAFTLTGPWQSIYGSWGHINDTDDPAPWTDRPKYQVIIDNANVYNTANCSTTIITGLQQKKGYDNGLTIFPNPSNSSVEVKGIPEDKLQNSSYEIVNLSGQIVMAGDFTKSNKLVLDNLSNGMFFIVIRDKNNNFVDTEKLIINR